MKIKSFLKLFVLVMALVVILAVMSSPIPLAQAVIDGGFGGKSGKITRIFSATFEAPTDPAAATDPAVAPKSTFFPTKTPWRFLPTIPSRRTPIYTPTTFGPTATETPTPTTSGYPFPGETPFPTLPAYP